MLTRSLPLLTFLLLLFCPFGSRAAITVNGIADEDIETGSASFTVPREPGFTIVAALNEERITLDTTIVVTTPGYYELAVTKTSNADQSVESEVIQFIVLDSSRGTSERGLITWVPYPTIDSASQAFAGAELEVITPPALPLGFEIPLIARVVDSTSGAGLRLNGTLQIPEAPGSEVRILRGFGSGFLPAPTAAGTTNLTPALHALGAPRAVQIEAATTWTTVSTDITTSTDWGTNARVSITSDITISAGATLTIGAGSVVQLAPGVEIQLDGKLLVNGSTSAPVFFSNVPGQSPWGGFLLQAAGSEVTATGAIFTGSGADSNWFSGSGYSTHRDEQATFLFDGTTGSFTDCFFIDLPGQALHGTNGTIDLTDCLIQRLPTVGQFNQGSVTVTRSALIEFDRNDDVFADDDNDGIYFTVGTHHLIDCVIGWAKDDGVDAGSGASGNVTVSGSWFEACFHEAMAWSGAGRTVNVSNSVAMNCGQGIEAGWSEGSNSPIVNVTNSLCVGNHVGWRYGDNYDWDYDGQLNVSDSLSLYNDRNVWGFEWDSWNYRADKMDIENNKLSEADPRQPLNTVWDGGSDAALLAPFLSVPGSLAGCGFGEWSLQKPEAEYGEEVTLSLSEPCTQSVSIDYEVARDFVVLATGSVQFSPGEIRKRISVPVLDQAPRDLVRVTLTGTSGGEFTTPRNLFYLATPAGAGTPQTFIATGAQWRYLDDGSDQGTAWRNQGFNDASWRSGAAELGYGDGDEATVVRFGPNEDNSQNDPDAKYLTTYFRKEFNVPNASLVGSLDLRIKRDDGMVVYLNGREIARDNVPANQDYLTESSNGSDEENTFLDYPGRDRTLLLTGTNTIAVEIHQDDGQSSDISFDLELIANPPTPLVFLLLRSGGELNLLWQGDPGLILQSSSDLETDWVEVPGARSPLRLTPGEPDPRKFFRLAE